MCSFFTLFASLFGIAVATVVLTMVILYSDLFVATCPSMNGRVCNGRGTCGDFAFCECMPMFSGSACEHTLCPGYDAASGTECSARGLCSPFRSAASIPLACREQTPSAANGFLRIGPGWSHPDCSAFIAVEPTAGPQCLCHPGYTGLACERLACPLTSDFLVCGGHGDPTVGLVRNESGDGCQCIRHVSLFVLTQILTQEEARALSHVDRFVQGFCGTPSRGSTGLMLIAQSPDDHRCFCDARHTGIACEFGVCPDIGGRVCAGFGNPDVGFGVVRSQLASLQPSGATCSPVCVPGTVMCALTGTCTRPGACRLACPSERPWRCPIGDCVAPAQFCDRGYIDGTWDALENIPSAVQCTLQSVGAGLTRLQRQRRAEACFGPDVLVGETFVSPGIPFTLPGRVVGWEVDGDAVVTATTPDLLFQDSGLVVNVVRDSPTRIRIRPPPATSRVRITSISGVLVADARETVYMPDLNGSLFRVEDSLFDVATGRGLVAGFACPLRQPDPCSSTPTVDPDTRVTAWLDASVDDEDIYIREDIQWTMEIMRVDPVTTEVSVNGTATYIKFVLDSDLRRACVCPSTGTNRSTLIRRWVLEPRLLPETVGEYAAGFRFSDPGVLIPTLGRVLAVTPLVSVLDHVLHIPVTLIRSVVKLSVFESTQGLIDDVLDVRCNDGTPSVLTRTTLTNLTRECTCTVTAIAVNCGCPNPPPVPDLAENCDWQPWRDPPSLARLTSEIPGVWVVTDGLVAGVSVNGTRTPLPLARRSLRIESNESVQVDIFTDFGGVPLLANVTFLANQGSVDAFADPNRTGIWESFDHPWLVLVLPRRIPVVSLFLDMVTVGLPVPYVTALPVSLSIQASALGGPWISVGSVSSSVVNGSHVVNVPIDPLRRAWDRLRVSSPFPLALRAAHPLVEQTCTAGLLSGTATQFDLSSDPACVCTDTCTIQGILRSNDGVCQDSIGLASTIACPAGTDCTDCGASTRTVAVQPRLKCGTGALIHFIQWGNATLTVTAMVPYTRLAWTRPTCLHECPFATCADGTCVSSLDRCTDWLVNCIGDGCVRSDIDSDRYSCACAPGRGGRKCELTSCVPGDSYTGQISPHRWCTCNGPSPLRIRPPFEFNARTPLTDIDILALNRPESRWSPDDVRWERVRAEKAPYGIPILRLHVRNGTRFFTNCPYRARTRRGLFLELEQCVAQRSVHWPYAVQEWAVHHDGERIVWTSEVEYDDAPFRCPTGECVAHERECLSRKQRHPMCGHPESICLVDGTCKCPFGRETWVLTPSLTEIVRIPYLHSQGVAQVTVWGEENDNRFVFEQCSARNCSQVDCSPQYGCFPGSLALQFADRLVPCPGTSRCALDGHACLERDMVDPLPCSGNGELRRRDYRDEWYCACGQMVDGVFTSNGFGGVACQDYHCQDNPDRIFFERQAPFTLEVYRDRNGLPLPGIWRGPCNALVGASPDDAADWNRCCPGEVQLERCPLVPCVVSGSTLCLDPDDCQGQSRVPKVYACNGKGRPLADGSCDCTKNVDAGTGFAPDLDVYSRPGCFKRVSCASARSGTPCNRIPTCGQYERWTRFPVIPYLEQQALLFAVRAGLPATNESIVRQLAGDSLNHVVFQAYVREALDIQAAIRAAATTVCILNANETCATAQGMTCRDAVLVYKQSIAAPTLRAFSMASSVETALLTDRIWVDGPISTAFYFNQALRTTYRNANIPFLVLLTAPTVIDTIRIHLYTDTGLSTVLTLLGDGAAPICPPFTVTGSTAFRWVEVTCEPTYTAVIFPVQFAAGWTFHCRRDELSILCIQWQEETCVGIARAQVQRAGSLQYFPGCPEYAVCCVANQDPFVPTSSVILTFSRLITLDELQVFGHLSVVEPLPAAAVTQLVSGLTGIARQCVDEIIFLHPDSRFVGDRGLFAYFAVVSPVHTFTPNIYHECSLLAGVVAAPLLDVPVFQSQAEEFGRACFTNPDGSLRPVGDRGCIVNARDRAELTFHQIWERYIQFDCLNRGCWDYDSLTHSFHHDPATGSQYDTASLGIANHRSWIDFFVDVRARQAVSVNERKNAKWIRTIPTLALTHLPLSTQVNGFIEYFSLFRPTPSATFTQAPDPLPTVNGQWQELWTTDETCTITFYSVPNCAAWCYGTISSACGNPFPCGYRTMEGSSYTFHVGAHNYDQVFGVNNPLNILDHPFDTPETDDTCAASGSRTVENNTNVGHLEFTHIKNGQSYTSKYFGTGGYYNQVYRVRDMRSLSIRGNCAVEIQGGVTGETDSYSYTKTYESHDRVGDGINFFAHGSNEQHTPPLIHAVQGCHSEIYSSSPYTRAACPPIVLYGDSADPFTDEDCADPLEENCEFPVTLDVDDNREGGSIRDTVPLIHLTPRSNSGTTTGPFRIGKECACCSRMGIRSYRVSADQVTSIRIYPRFSGQKVRFVPKALVRDANQLNDEAEIGFRDHPFMPMVVRVERTAYFETGAGIVFNTLTLLDDAPVVPTSGNDGQFFRATGNPLSPVTLPFTSVPQYRRCDTCLNVVAQDFRFHTEFHDVQTGIAVRMDESAPGVSVQHTVDFYVIYIDRFFELINVNIRLATLRHTGAYGRIISAPQRVVFMDFPRYVIVHRVASSGDFQFQFTRVLGNFVAFFGLCMRNIRAYTARAGTQCDACGPSSRTQRVQPGATAFSLFPRALATNDPFGHMILGAYLNGTLDVLIDRKEAVPWDAIRAGLVNTSVVFAFAEAREALESGYSSRPRFLSAGATAEPTWIDVHPSRWFPVDCGLVTDPVTKIVHRRCAVSQDHCLPRNDRPAQEMALSDIPAIVATNLTATRRSVLCTEPVPMHLVHRFTQEGGPQPIPVTIEVIDETDESVELRMLAENGTWANTGRRMPSLDLSMPFTLVGEVTASVTVGEYRVWAAPLSPTFAMPSVTEDVVPWRAFGSGEFDVSHTPAPDMAVIGVDVRHMQVSSRVTLGSFRFGSAALTDQCLSAPRVHFVELPTHIHSAAPVHECNFEIGECQCEAASPFGGPTCEWPAVLSPRRGKQVCHGYGQDGGRAYTSSGGTSPVTQGVFDDDGLLRCTCVDPGLTLLTVLRASSAIGFSFVVRRDHRPNTDEFTVVVPPADIDVPVTEENAIATCNGESAALPSWNTGAEAIQAALLVPAGTFVDLRLRDGELVWLEREETFSGNSSLSPEHPCDDPGLCAALNWNNIAFLRSSSNSVTDGRDVVVAVSFPISVDFSALVSYVRVEVHKSTSGTPSVFAVTASGTSVCALVSTDTQLLVTDCLVADISRLQLVFGGSLPIREVRVFPITDTTRAAGYF